MLVFYSNFQEHLLEELLGNISQDRKSFKLHYLLFPSQALKVYYQAKIAERLGSTLDINFACIDEIDQLATDIALQTSFLDESDLEKITSIWSCLWKRADFEILSTQILSDFDIQLHKEEGHFYEALKSSSLAFEMKNRPFKSVYPFAKILSSCFYHYSQQAESSLISENSWQAFLYKSVRKEKTSFVTFAELVENLEKWQLSSSTSPLQISLHLISFSYLPPSGLKWIESLSKKWPVSWYFLSPTRLYWSDMSGFFAMQKQLMAANLDTSEAVFAKLEELLLERHPLLTSMAEMSRKLVKFLEAHQTHSIDNYILPCQIEGLKSYDDLWKDDLQSLEKPFSLLKGVQLDLLLMRPYGPERRLSLASDLSLVVHKCQDPKKEVATLKNHLIRLLQNDSTLKLDEILVLSPSIHDYKSFIESEFELGPFKGRYRVHDVSVMDTEGLFSTLIKILDFATGTWTLSNYLGLFEILLLKESFLSNSLKHFFDEATQVSSVSWGVDSKHRYLLRHSMGLHLEEDKEEERTWDYFWKELFNTLSQDSYQADLKEMKSVYLGSKSLEMALEFHYTLLRCLKSWYTQENLSLKQWVHLTSQIVEELLDSSKIPEKERLRFTKILKEIALDDEGVHVAAVSFTDLLQERLKSVTLSWSYPYDGYLRFASLQPMRALPAKHICMLGMSQDFESKVDIKPHFLWKKEMGVEPLPSKYQLDRYSFMEALVCSRESFHLFYSQTTNEEAFPNYLVSELMSYLDQAFEIDGQLFSECFHLQHPHSINSVEYSRWPLCEFSHIETSLPSQTPSWDHSSLVTKKKEHFDKILKPWDIEKIIYDPLGYYLSCHVGSLRAFENREPLQPFELVAQNHIHRKWPSDTPKKDNKQTQIYFPKIEKQSHSAFGAYLHSEKLLNRVSNLERKIKRVPQYTEIIFSEGYRVLDLKTRCSLPTTTLPSFFLLKSERNVKFVGRFKKVDLQHPCLILGRRERLDFLKQLFIYALLYQERLLTTSSLEVVSTYDPKKSIKHFDLSSLDVKSWLESIARASLFLEDNRILFHGELASHLQKIDPDRYAKALEKLVQKDEEESLRRLSLFLGTSGFDSRKAESLKLANFYHASIHEYLYPIWKVALNFFEVHSIEDVKQEQDLEL